MPERSEGLNEMRMSQREDEPEGRRGEGKGSIRADNTPIENQPVPPVFGIY
jgi:hypothetical protein